MLDHIEVRGARQHNLCSVDIDIPRNTLTVMTGLSGSGKSSLAFDTIYAEGQHRYVETLSPYARQFLGKLGRPDVDSIDGLSPALSIDQNAAGQNPRSTVGTITEVYDYLRLLFSTTGTAYCAKCDEPITRQSLEAIVEMVERDHAGETVTILAPIVRGRKGTYFKQLQAVLKKGYSSVRIDGSMRRLRKNRPIVLNRFQRHSIEVHVDSVVIREGSLPRLRRSIRVASDLAGGLVITLLRGGTETVHSTELACRSCGRAVSDLAPRSFSFNSNFGWCTACRGLGRQWEVDPGKLIVNPDRPIAGGLALARNAPCSRALDALQMWASVARVDLKQPWRLLPPLTRKWILFGSESGLPTGSRLQITKWRGFVAAVRAEWGHVRWAPPSKRQLPYMSDKTCPECGGGRLRAASRSVRVDGLSIDRMAALPIGELSERIGRLAPEGPRAVAATRIVDELRDRLVFLVRVGLHYLTLDRPAATLSGGEAQRVRLATQIGSRLRGVLYVLDEPSIGLHSRDHHKLLDALQELRDRGNTVIVVEHDQATIERADFVVDLGPGAGRLGGEIVAMGSPTQVRQARRSLTGLYLAGSASAVVRSRKPRPRDRHLVVRGARQHNLRNVDVQFPLGNLCAVTGVSGSGKSTLVNDVLYRALAKELGAQVPLEAGAHDGLEGTDQVDKVVGIDQTPIGRTPRSNPATYTGVFTPIRDLYSMLPEARARGYKKGRFSFNVTGGRCDDCSGNGSKRIDMKFLPDVYVLCETCGGRRFKKETLQIRYKGHSIADVLEMTIEQALGVMENLPPVRRKLQTLVDVGLEYIQLGQPSTTISGGEAQRVKLARELSKKYAGRIVYVLDEPTTGLHFADVQKLLEALHRLVDRGSTVIVIEHNLDVIASADWIIDLGPEGGDQGGYVVCAGPPEEVARTPASYTGRALSEAGLA